MKNRIIALILVVVMSLLTLVSCGGSFDFVEEDLSAYVDFDYKGFMDALQKLEIEDSDYTTDPTIRAQKELESIYDKVVEAILKSTYESDQKTEGELGDGDVLYFIYYAVDEATGNVYFYSEMKEASITASSTKDKHVINLGNVDEEDEFKSLIKENITGEMKPYVVLTADDLKAEAKKAALEANASATEDEIKNAQKEAVKVVNGKTYVITYSRSYETTNAEGVVSTTVETANYVTVTLDKNNPFHAKFFEEKSVANVGDKVTVFDAEKDKNVSEFVVEEINGEEVIKYTYSKVQILWEVKDAGTPIATFKYTPYDSENKVNPDNLTASGKQDLKGVELTYYVYPAYAVSAPAPQDITALDILVHLYGKSISKTALKVFENEKFVNGDKKIADLIAEIAKIYGGTDETYYAKDSELKTLYDAHQKAKTDGGSKPSTEQQKVIDAAAEALTKAQNAEAKKIFQKIVEAKNGEELAGTAIFEEYREDIAHTLKEAYDTEIVQKVQAEVWKLINESDKYVKVKAYPQEVIDEFYEILYESYESDYYTGDYSTSQSNYNKYADLEAFLIATLKITNASEIEGAIIKEAKGYADSILKIFAVAKACYANGAADVVKTYIENDIKDEIYEEDEIEGVREEADFFLIDDAYMKYYKKQVGRAYYRAMVESYGEINIRAGFQFNKLFYYLTSTDLVMTEEEGEEHGHAEREYVTIDGKEYISFRTVKYTIVEPTEEDVDSDASVEQ